MLGRCWQVPRGSKMSPPATCHTASNSTIRRYAPGLQLKTFSGTVEGWTLPPERITYTLHLDSPSPLGRGSQPGLGLVGWLHGIGIPGTGGNREKGGRQGSGQAGEGPRAGDGP